MSDPNQTPPPVEDPAALARRLAAEAKARLESPPPDPRELAKRLAAEAKARNAEKAAAEDPAAMARRLAAEAKARIQAAAAPAAAPAAPPPEPAAPAAPTRSLSERARRPLSAAEAFRIAAEREAQEAREAEAAEAARQQALAAEKAAEPAPAPAAPVVAAPAVAPVAAPAAPSLPPAVAAEPTLYGRAPQEVLRERLPDVEVLGLTTVHDRAVFRALWRSHRARARAEGALELLVTADVLLDAAERVPAGALHALHIRSAGRPWAAWVDGDRQVVLGLAPTPDIYLAGL